MLNKPFLSLPQTRKLILSRKIHQDERLLKNLALFNFALLTFLSWNGFDKKRIIFKKCHIYSKLIFYRRFNSFCKPLCHFLFFVIFVFCFFFLHNYSYNLVFPSEIIWNVIFDRTWMKRANTFIITGSSALAKINNSFVLQFKLTGTHRLSKEEFRFHNDNRDRFSSLRSFPVHHDNF